MAEDPIAPKSAAVEPQDEVEGLLADATLANGVHKFEAAISPSELLIPLVDGVLLLLSSSLFGVFNHSSTIVSAPKIEAN